VHGFENVGGAMVNYAYASKEVATDEVVELTGGFNSVTAVRPMYLRLSLSQERKRKKQLIGIKQQATILNKRLPSMICYPQIGQ